MRVDDREGEDMGYGGVAGTGLGVGGVAGVGVAAGALPRTGVGLGLLLALGVILFVAGLALVRAAHLRAAAGQ